MPASPRRVLLVEDEYLIAMLLGDMLAELDCTIAATAETIDRALAAVQDGAFDLALLDLRLNEVATYPVAAALRERGIPFAFVTGYNALDIESAYADVPLLQKPFRLADLAQTLARLLSGR